MKAPLYDLVVIGSGPAGEKAAAQAAYFGKKVCLVEKESEPGGAAVHTGTLPSKTLRETALYLSGFRARHLYGVAVELDQAATVQKLMARKNAIADAEAQRIRANLRHHDVTYLRGRGSFVDAHTVRIRGGAEEQLVEGDFIMVATGSTPRQPADIDFEDDCIHDSDEILHIEELPASMTILGAGVIGCEYACMFAALGVQITLVDSRESILGFLDREIVARLEHAMKEMGITMVQGQRWGAVERQGDVITAALPDGRLLKAQHLLFAAGRVGRSADLGLEELGVEVSPRGHIVVDAEYRTTVPHILAAGDVIGFPALASTSMEQGRVAVCRAFDFAYKSHVSTMLPYGIYTIPEVSCVGLSEEDCLDKKIPHVTGRAFYKDNARGQITGDVEGITKLVVHKETRVLLGVHVIGERASELVHIGLMAMMLGGTVDVFIDMVFNFPTLAESYKYAAYECLAALAEA